MKLSLKKIRKNAGLNQTVLGELVGVSQQMISHYETGRRDIPVGVAKKIGAICKVDWWKLYE